MGFGIKELVIILVIVLLLFGTKKLKTLGSDLGSAIKGFRKSISDDNAPDSESESAEKREQKPEEEKEGGGQPRH